MLSAKQSSSANTKRRINLSWRVSPSVIIRPSRPRGDDTHVLYTLHTPRHAVRYKDGWESAYERPLITRYTSYNTSVSVIFLLPTPVAAVKRKIIMVMFTPPADSCLEHPALDGKTTVGLC